MWSVSVSIFIIIINLISCQEIFLKIALLKNTEQEAVAEWFQNLLKSLETANLKLDAQIIDIEGEDEEDYSKICNAFSDEAIIIIDATWSKNEIIKKVTADVGVPLVSVDLSISPALKLLDKFLDYKNASDVVVIYDNNQNIDQSLYYWLDTTRMRLLVTENLDKISAERLKNLRPTPNSYAIIANSSNLMNLIKLAINEDLLTLPERWHLVALDFEYNTFNRKLISNQSISLLKLKEEMCCSLLKLNSCDCPDDFDMEKQFMALVMDLLVKAINVLITEKIDINKPVQCNETKYDEQVVNRFNEVFSNLISSNNNLFDDKGVLRIKLLGTIETGLSGNKEVAYYNEDNGLRIVDEKLIKPIKPFYRIGTTHALPWSYQAKHPITGEMYWTGYCIDFAKKLAEMMNFDYEIVAPKKGKFGKKRNGIWDGVIGDLLTGETDLALTALIMTADREEVVDFVAPYFEQTGISIVMRKPVRKTSLFKFMTVLKLEVWLSIVAALIVTGFMVWFLDKYSPYSARNNKKAYPYPCREFSLKESFWFALTSFTPQGGGEAPKALSGRTLVAAYWLFVVLMLATFTANLAAFLTVERMQTPVQSLEQLARQSRINYTVVEGSDTHQYFINMKHAEDTLYRMWKELTLNASTDETQYRVWDYPIREQYGHILISINDSMPVASAKEGFRKVNERTDADFAFIHDSSEIKYEISRNCNLTEVGEVFGEKPYAVAVQQGSHLQDEISRKILELQKDRFFDDLQEKYWNHSNAGLCPGTDDSEGITLESLGGVFIATLFGLALAMLTLAGEVIYYRRKKKIKPKTENEKKIAKIKFIKQNLPESETFAKNVKAIESDQSTKPITFGTTFKPIKLDKNQSEVPHITLYPQARNRLSKIN